MTEHDPSHAEPEYLGEEQPPQRLRPRRATALAVAGVVAASVALSGWAASGFMSSSDNQPADVVPAAAIAYVGVDLDPTASQKVEALRMAGKVPALKEKLGLSAGDDLRRWLFQRSGLDACDGVDYDDDVAPWIGERAGFALLPGDRPHPVVALAVDDTDRARDALARLSDCAEDRSTHEDHSDDPFAGKGLGHDPGFALTDGHVVLAESTERAEAAVSEAEDGSLAEDASFRRWTDEAGAAGVVTGYLSPRAPQVLAGGSPFGGSGDPAPAFEGMGAVLRFADGTLELELATAGLPPVLSDQADGAGAQQLPEDTGASLSVALAPGWAGRLLDAVGRATGMPPQMLADAAEARTGLALPGDVERLLGERVSVAVDGSSDRHPRGGVRVLGDPDEVVPLAERLADALGGRDLVSVSERGVVALGRHPAYLRELAADGSLGESPRFRSAVPDADRASLVAYADLDRSWAAALTAGLDRLPGRHRPSLDETDLRANIAPLDTLGAAVWSEGDVQRGLLRLSTD